MERRRNTPLLPDLLKGTLATVLLAVAYATLPLLGSVAAFFLPFPAVFYGLKNRMTAAAIVALAAAGIGALLGWGAIPLYLILVGSVSLIIVEGIPRGWSWGRILVSSATVATVAGGIGAAVLWQMSDITPDAVVTAAVNQTVKAVQELSKAAGGLGDDAQAMEQALRLLQEMIISLYPALGVAFVVLSATATLAAMRRRLPAGAVTGSFTAFRTPDHFIWVVIAGGFAVVIPDADMARIGGNVLCAGLSLYLVQGFAVLTFFLDKYRIPPLLRAVIYILLVALPYLTIALLLVGLFDLWIGFRVTKPKNL